MWKYCREVVIVHRNPKLDFLPEGFTFKPKRATNQPKHHTLLWTKPLGAKTWSIFLRNFPHQVKADNSLGTCSTHPFAAFTYLTDIGSSPASSPHVLYLPSLKWPGSGRRADLWSFPWLASSASGPSSRTWIFPSCFKENLAPHHSLLKTKLVKVIFLINS